MSSEQVGDLCALALTVDARQPGSEAQLIQHLRTLIGDAQRDWLDNLLTRYQATIDAITSPDGEVISEPLFVLRGEQKTIAVYPADQPPARAEVARLEDHFLFTAMVGEPL